MDEQRKQPEADDDDEDVRLFAAHEQKRRAIHASTWSNLTPCNMHIDTLADAAAMGAVPAVSRLAGST